MAELQVGDTVEVEGMTRDLSLNGQVGEVMEFRVMSDGTEGAVVQLESGARKLLRFENLVVVQYEDDVEEVTDGAAPPHQPHQPSYAPRTAPSYTQPVEPQTAILQQLQTQMDMMLDMKLQQEKEKMNGGEDHKRLTEEQQRFKEEQLKVKEEQQKMEEELRKREAALRQQELEAERRNQETEAKEERLREQELALQKQYEEELDAERKAVQAHRLQEQEDIKAMKLAFIGQQEQLMLDRERSLREKEALLKKKHEEETKAQMENIEAFKKKAEAEALELRSKDVEQLVARELEEEKRQLSIRHQEEEEQHRKEMQAQKDKDALESQKNREQILIAAEQEAKAILENQERVMRERETQMKERQIREIEESKEAAAAEAMKLRDQDVEGLVEKKLAEEYELLQKKHNEEVEAQNRVFAQQKKDDEAKIARLRRDILEKAEAEAKQKLKEKLEIVAQQEDAMRSRQEREKQRCIVEIQQYHAKAEAEAVKHRKQEVDAMVRKRLEVEAKLLKKKHEDELALELREHKLQREREEEEAKARMDRYIQEKEEEMAAREREQNIVLAKREEELAKMRESDLMEFRAATEEEREEHKRQLQLEIAARREEFKQQQQQMYEAHKASLEVEAQQQRDATQREIDAMLVSGKADLASQLAEQEAEFALKQEEERARLFEEAAKLRSQDVNEIVAARLKEQEQALIAEQEKELQIKMTEQELELTKRKEEIEASVDTIIADRLRDKMVVVKALEEETIRQAQFRREDGTFMKEEEDKWKKRMQTILDKEAEVEHYKRESLFKIAESMPKFNKPFCDWESQYRKEILASEKQLWAAFISMYQRLKAERANVGAQETTARNAIQQEWRMGEAAIEDFWRMQARKFAADVAALWKKDTVFRTVSAQEERDAFQQIIVRRKEEAAARAAFEEVEAAARSIIIREQMQMRHAMDAVKVTEAANRGEVETAEMPMRKKVLNAQLDAWGFIVRLKHKAWKEEVKRRQLQQRRLWTADTAVKGCEECEKRFGIVVRRHHCRQCGGIYCSTCSKHRVSIPKHGYDSRVRVCDTCAKHDKWKSTRESPACTTCGTNFTFLKRRHYCRSCGDYFCSKCTNYKVSLLDLGHLGPQRVCETCYSQEEALLEQNGQNWMATDGLKAGLVSDHTSVGDAMSLVSQTTFSTISFYGDIDELAEKATVRRKETKVRMDKCLEVRRRRGAVLEPAASPSPPAEEAKQQPSPPVAAAREETRPEPSVHLAPPEPSRSKLSDDQLSVLMPFACEQVVTDDDAASDA